MALSVYFEEDIARILSGKIEMMKYWPVEKRQPVITLLRSLAKDFGINPAIFDEGEIVDGDVAGKWAVRRD